MAIIIHSDNIYGIQNDKIIQNAISSIKIEEKNIELKNDSEKSEHLSADLALTKLDGLDSGYTNKWIFPNKGAIEPKYRVWYGKYIFDENIPSNAYFVVPINFISNGRRFTAFYTKEDNSIWYRPETGEDINVYNKTAGWIEEYRTILVDSAQKETDILVYDVSCLKSQSDIVSGLYVDFSYIKLSGTPKLDRNKSEYYITNVSPTLELVFDVYDVDKKLKLTYYANECATPDINFGSSVIKEDIVSYTKYETQGNTYSNDGRYEEQPFSFYSDVLISDEISGATSSLTANFNASLLGYTIKVGNMELSDVSDFLNFPYKIIANENKDSYTFDIQICDKIIVSWGQTFVNDMTQDSTKDFVGKFVELTLKKARIVYNETNRYVTSTSNTRTLSNLSNENEGDKDISLGSNPFIRKQNTKNGLPLTETLYNKTLELYKDGKEQVKLLCSIGEYNDENGNRIISTQTSDKMVFDNGDEILPCYSTVYGQAPISVKDGKPKLFQVLGNRTFFDGAVWQEITAQESGTSDFVIENGSKGLAYEEINGSLYCIGKGDFDGADIKVSSLVNGRRVFGIAEKSFYANSNITSINILNGISEIGLEAFAFCENLSNINMPDSLTEIGELAFYNCDKIKNIYVPKSVNKIGFSAFSYCSSINTISIPFIGADKYSGITHLGYIFGASSYNDNGNVVPYSLENVVLADGVYIDSFAFLNCYNIKNITIPSTVKTIGGSAFEGCTSLKNIYYKGSKSQWDAINIESGNDSLLNANIHYNAQ